MVKEGENMSQQIDVPSQGQTVQFQPARSQGRDNSRKCGDTCQCCAMTLVLVGGFVIALVGMGITMVAYLVASDPEDMWYHDYAGSRVLGPILLALGGILTVGGCVWCKKGCAKDKGAARRNDMRMTTSGTTVSYSGAQPSCPIGDLDQQDTENSSRRFSNSSRRFSEAAHPMLPNSPPAEPPSYPSVPSYPSASSLSAPPPSYEEVMGTS